VRFAFSEEQRELARVVRELLARACPPAAVRAAWDAPWDAASPAWKELADAGVIGMTAPERFGGGGATELDLTLVLEECGRAALPGPLIEHTAIAVPLVAEACDDATCDRLLGAAATGDGLLTFLVHGERFVESGERARLILFHHRGGLGACEPGKAGLTREPSVDGARRVVTFHCQSELAISLAPATPRTAAAIARAADRAAWAAAAQLVGLGRRMIEMTVEYVGLRKQFGRAVGSFQAVKHALAEAHVALELARPCVHRAAYALAHREPDASIHASTAKALASDAALLAARTALQCHGAIGYSFEHDLHLWMKRAWALAAAWGSAAHHRARVAAALFDSPPAPAS
jgi:alkylation response protein AidB-like acyl-CoA dehydrogenase